MPSSRSLIVSVLLLSAACSQRAPYRSVDAHAPRPQAAPRPGPVSLSTAAPADVTAVAGVLLFPVPGIDGSRVPDSFDAPRDGGARRHQAIDILAPRGTPVLSVDDGQVLRLSRGGNGGIALYAADVSERFVYYYAHLDRYHPTMHAGRPLVRGDTIGYVGTTGNAPAHVPHLHFQMMRMPADGRFWNGEPINPHPLFRANTHASSAP